MLPDLVLSSDWWVQYSRTGCTNSLYAIFSTSWGKADKFRLICLWFWGFRIRSTVAVQKFKSLNTSFGTRRSVETTCDGRFFPVKVKDPWCILHDYGRIHLLNLVYQNARKSVGSTRRFRVNLYLGQLVLKSTRSRFGQFVLIDLVNSYSFLSQLVLMEYDELTKIMRLVYWTQGFTLRRCIFGCLLYVALDM